MKTLLTIAAFALLISCGPKLDDKGNLGGEAFIGKFHGIDIWRVVTPEGVTLYIGVKGGQGLDFVSHERSAPKGGTTRYPLILVDGASRE